MPMDRQTYLKAYKQYHYKQTRKVISFPLLMSDYELLKSRADAFGMKATRLSKDIVLNYIENSPNQFITPKQEALISEYIRVSRGIANNINQIAYNSNIGEWIDVKLLIDALKRYEDEFKDLIQRL